MSKYIFLTTKFPPENGGVQNSNYELVKVISELGNDIKVFTIDSKKKEIDSEIDIVRAKWIYNKYITQNNLIIRLFCYFFFALRFLFFYFNHRDHKLILSDSHTRRIHSLFLFYINSYITITSIPEDIKNWNGLHGKLFKSLMERTYYKSEKIFTVSNSTKNDLINKFGKINTDKIIVIYRNINNNFFFEKNQESINELSFRYNLNNKFVLLSVSRLVKAKGIDNTLKAISLLPEYIKKNMKYLIVGYGEYKNELRKLTKQLELGNSVIFIGEVKYKDVFSFYDLCDLFILPSKRGKDESFGRVFAEAGARKKTVIANNTGGVKEVVVDKETGFLVDPNQIEEIKDKIIELYEDENLRIKMGENAHQYVLNNFSKEAFKNRIKELL